MSARAPGRPPSRSRKPSLLAAALACTSATLVALPSTAATLDTGAERHAAVQKGAYCSSKRPTWGPLGSATDPWGTRSNWRNAGRPYVQPILGSCIPDVPERLGALDDGDFDGDGVRNIDDNCLLVPNAGQQPAVTSGVPIGPADVVGYSRAWKASHPDARFRDDNELGEACSGHTKSYLRTTKALIELPAPTKIDVFRYLGAAGPSLGGATDPLAGPTARGGAGNMVPSLPMCGDFNRWANFFQWMVSGKDGKFNSSQAYTGMLDCGKAALIRLIEESGFDAWFWAGKKVYTNQDGGRITNRFFPGITETPPVEALARHSTRTPFSSLKLSPYGDGQSRHGYLFPGTSYQDGRSAWVMDWRGFEASWPLWLSIPHVGAFLIYDECRAIQTGVYHCMAIVDVVRGDKRYTFQEGFMPWVVKGPPSRAEYLAAIR